MKKVSDRAAAFYRVTRDLTLEVKRRQDIVSMHPPGQAGDTYRREIARLWRVALRAVRQAKRDSSG